MSVEKKKKLDEQIKYMRCNECKSFSEFEHWRRRTNYKGHERICRRKENVITNNTSSCGFFEKKVKK